MLRYNNSMDNNDQEKTGLGNYFISNYPPFSAWKPEHLAEARRVMQAPPREQTPLGLYLHIPFCRKRCKFCYYRVYTDKNARDVEMYIDALVREVEICSQQPVVGGRPLHFVYFGGGTPSFLSVPQLEGLVRKLQHFMPWDKAEEIAFEAEPGTLQRNKLAAIKDLGVTRLSLGIENFSDEILKSNGRAHLSPEIYRSYGWARELGFAQISIDLIAGMVGETWDNWRDCIKKTIELFPDAVTIYQMELPYNTVYSKELQQAGQTVVDPSLVADWPTKRAWVDYAFNEFVGAGYAVSTAYTVVRNPAPCIVAPGSPPPGPGEACKCGRFRKCEFVYRDSLWHGADMFGTGVSSFGHVNGVHVQNADTWEPYLAMLQRGELPLGRALPVTPRQLLMREMMLQLKTGRLWSPYFQKKYQVDILREFADGFSELKKGGWAVERDGNIELTRPGLLQVDRLLPTFFEQQYRGGRYT